MGQFEYSPASRKSKPVTEKEPERRMSLSPSSSEDSDLLTSKESPRAKGQKDIIHSRTKACINLIVCARY